MNNFWLKANNKFQTPCVSAYALSMLFMNAILAVFDIANKSQFKNGGTIENY